MRSLNYVETPDELLVGQARSGDAAAFEQLVHRYYPVCLRFAARQLGVREDAEEAVQDAFLRAQSALVRCQDPVHFRAWLFAILVNRCRTQLKRSRRRKLLLAHWWEKEPRVEQVEPSEFTELDPRLSRALAELSPALREALLLKHVEQMTYEEIQTVTGVSVSALKMRVKRAAGLLAARLEDLSRV